MRPQFFVQPVTVHDVKMDLVSPITIQVFVGCSSMATTMHGILVCTGTDLETKVKKAFGVVIFVFLFLAAGQGPKLPGKPCGRSFT